MKRQLFKVIFCASLIAGIITQPVSAALLKTPDIEKESSSTAAKTPAVRDTQTPTNAFTGSTPLAQYLYEKLSSSPDTLSVPTSKITAKSAQAIFTELGDALEEAFIQNGLVDHMTDMKFTYTPGKGSVTVKLTYNIKDAATRQAHKTTLAQKADSILTQVIKAEMTQQEKAEALYHYISTNVTYDYEALNDFVDKPEGKSVYTRQTAYAALVEGKAICQGFSRAYKLLCDRANVPCVVVFGQVRNNGIAHSWNRINVTGSWATVDTSNTQLRICTQNGIFIPEDTAAAALSANKTSIVDNKADLYF